MTFSPSSANAVRSLQREQFVILLQTARQSGYLRFARQAALLWLGAFPGDLPLSLLYAQTLLQEGHAEQALPLLEKLCQVDPEYLEAVQARLIAEHNLRVAKTRKSTSASPSRSNRTVSPSEFIGWITALGGEIPPITQAKISDPGQQPTLLAWSQPVRQARQALEKPIDRNLEQAGAALHTALMYSAANPLIGITHLRLLRAIGAPFQSLQSLAQFYQQQWPQCLQFQLLLAEALMNNGQTEQGVSLLHQAVSRDLTGQVARRLWGEDHPYRALWPESLEMLLDLPIPAAVAAALGWNQLPQNLSVHLAYSPEDHSEQENDPYPSDPALQPTQAVHLSRPKAAPIPTEEAQTSIDRRPPPVYPTLPETLRSVQAELERVAERLHQPSLARCDGRFPVYVVMTTRHGLSTYYGQEAATLIENEMRRLVQAVQARRDWRALLFYADEGLPPAVAPARPTDPWALKLALVDLDAALARRGEMIGAVLIVGGPEIVPFHHLPNPVDDADHDVPSDNPYSTRDENYFIPEWPLGRLPGGASRQPQMLCDMLRRLSDYHANLARQQRSTSRTTQLWRALLSWLKGWRRNIPRPRPALGYSAAVWKQTSQIVYRPIGEPKTLHTSPPLGQDGHPPAPLPAARLAYFNLHGLIDAVEWFGQSAPLGSQNSSVTYKESIFDPGNVDYPVALRPQDIVNHGHAPQVVFSEACYGAHLLGRTVEDSLALKFLHAGSQAVVGSTCIAYGSVSPPLTAADFLGHEFWNALRQGVPAGEALRRAKIALAREMHHRQGYLDGEDQKTLISFVLYGDPLALPLNMATRQAKTILRPLKPPRWVQTVCDRAEGQEDVAPLPAEIETFVKKVVEQYLPSMAGAQVSLSQERIECTMEGHICPTGQLRTSSAHKGSGQKAQGLSLTPSPRRVVRLSKQVNEVGHVHHHYARLTLDEQNRLVKLVVSR
jgi:tetratricopeptide (TPR) repeat protein